MNFIRRFDTYRGLPRSVYILFIVRIINSMGNFVYPFLTFFLTERVKLSVEATGIYFLVRAVAQNIGSITGGKLTDRYGRKMTLIIFSGLSAVCFIPCAFLGDSILIPAFLIMSGLFMGASQPVNTALVTDLTNKENRKQVFSLLYMGSNIGFSIGPMIAGFLYENHANWIFYGNSFAIIISLVLIVLFIEETLPQVEIDKAQENDKDDEAAEKGGVIRALLRRPLLLLFSLGGFTYQLVYSSIGFAIPLQMEAAFGSTLGPQYYGIMASLNGFVVILFTILVTRLTIKLKPLMNLALAGLFYAVGFGMIGISGSMPLYFLAVFIYTTGEILDITNSGVYIANHSPVTHRGRFNAVINMITSSGFALGPLLFGNFISAFGLPRLWLLCFILPLASGGFLMYLRLMEIREKRNVTNAGITES